MGTIKSEDIEPTLAHCIGVWYDNLQKSGKTLFDYAEFWHSINIALMFASECNCTHAIIVMMNHARDVAGLIKAETGIDPILDNNPIFKR